MIQRPPAGPLRPTGLAAYRPSDRALNPAGGEPKLTKDYSSLSLTTHREVSVIVSDAWNMGVRQHGA